MIDAQIINKILGVTDSYQAPARLLELMLDEETREETFRAFLEYETDTSYEWFQSYYEQEHAERKSKAQDFTPVSVSRLLARLTKDGNTYFESGAGNGGILIQAWLEHRNKNIIYNPIAYWYQVEELSDRSIPFLIFNMAIRGMNGVILHGDSLTQEFKAVYFIRNESTNPLNFSEVHQIDLTPELEEFFATKEVTKFANQKI